jgi:hypothetical protein
MSSYNHILSLLNELNHKVNIVMATLQDIANEVTLETTIDQSIVTLLDGIAAQLQTALNNNDPVAMQTVLTNLQANAKILSDAIAANTPVAPAPVTPAPVIP